MAYTDQWPTPPESTPPDSELANLLANNVRKLELDIRERMDDVFTDASGTWAASGPASPVVVAAALTGKVTGKKLTLHWSAFVKEWDFSSTNAGAFDDKFVQGPANTVYVAAVPLPVGV